MQHEYQYMVDFTLPELLSEDFLRLIPHQRSKVHKLFQEGKLVNYALSLDNSKMWAVVSANSEKEVKKLLSELPLAAFMEVQVSMLTFFNSVGTDAPVFSMN